MNAIFTICAKNYLAQALTLMQSVKKCEEVDFYIYLADSAETIYINEVRKLDEKWIPNWQSMAFKYNVVEFSTSIKPFCIKQLFLENYDKVIYLDPDIYVTNKLDYIWNALDHKSMLLTPHYCDIQLNFNGAVSESILSGAGIFNLGFFAVRNNQVGKSVVEWWCKRLKNLCYDESSEGLFVDQKWMDFIPALFPDDVLISHNHGLNVAIWNLHERQLLVNDNKYVIKRLKTGEFYDLLFFHFSGFNPHDSKVINVRHPEFNVDTYPSFSKIIEEYRNIIFKNKFDEYNKMSYAFSSFSNKEDILIVNRRMYRQMLNHGIVSEKENPFDVNNLTYSIFKQSRVLSRTFNRSMFYPYDEKVRGEKIEKKYIHPLLKLIKWIIGISKYQKLTRLAKHIGKLDYHYCLIRNDKKNGIH